MVNTYTTNFRFINNGDTTIENPEDLVGEQDLIISNAQIQWEGSTTTGSNTSYSTNTNTGSVTATTSTQYNNNSTSTGYATATPKQYYSNQWSDSEFIDGAGDGDSVSPVNFPSINDTSRFEHHKVIVEIEPDPDKYDDSREYTLDYGGLSVSLSNENINMTAGGYKKITKTVNSYNPGDQGYITLHKPWSDGNDAVMTVTIKTVYSSPSSSDTVYRSYPSVPSGYNFHKHEMVVDGNTTTYYSNKVGDSVSVTSYDSNNTKSLLLRTYGKKTVTNSDTTYVSYPSVPNGYDFDRHYFRIERNGSYQDSDYVYSNNVGSSKSITSNDPSNTWTLEMRTRGETTNYYTNYTQDPSVSGNVSASTGATLNDNETSSWQSLSDFGVGDNSFNHSVSDSGEAYYRIRFDWEYSYPTELAELKFFDGSSQYSVRLADPADDGLDYNSVKAYINGVGVVALDVVDPSDPDASNFFIYHPTQGVLALRKK